MTTAKSSPHRSKAKKILSLFSDKQHLLDAALTHPSYRHETACPVMEDFDRLEFFGDAILNYAICKRLYELFPKADEGELSRLRSTLVSRKILIRVAKDLRLERLIRCGKSLQGKPSELNGKIMADTLEALFAAIYFEGGIETAEKFIAEHFEPYLDAKRLQRIDPNPKSALQELCQKKWRKLPVYTWKDTPKGIQTEIVILADLKASAYGTSRRQSEEKAARLLIRKIRQRGD